MSYGIVGSPAVPTAAPSGRLAALASVAAAGLVEDTALEVDEVDEPDDPDVLGVVLVVEVVLVVDVDPLVEELDEVDELGAAGGVAVGVAPVLLPAFSDRPWKTTLVLWATELSSTSSEGVSA